jgi:enoyl-CoA hydratase/carnithine racemase
MREDSVNYFRTELRGRVLLVRIHNPPRQYFSIDMLPELNALLDDIERRESVLGVIFTGSAPDTFLSHLDPASLTALTQRPAEVEEAAEGLAAAQEVIRRLGAMPQVTVAAINGHAWGAGCEIALACDVRIIADKPSAGLAMLESTIGLTPGLGAAYRLRQLVGPSRAFHMLVTAKAVGPAEALRMGLVHEVLPAADFVEQVVERAAGFTFNTRESLRHLRRCIYGDQRDIVADGRLEQQVFAEALRSDTTARRMRAMAEHRPNGNGGRPATRVPAFVLRPVLRARPGLMMRRLGDYFRADRAAGVSGSYCLRFAGRRDEAWTVSVREGRLSVASGADGSADVTMIATPDDWVRFMTGGAEDVELFVSDRLRIHGDVMRALEFRSLFLDA